MSNYTKGEWNIGEILDANFHAKLRTITSSNYQDGGFPFICYVNDAPNECEANAHLIAAAPMMYEALKELVDTYSIPDDYTENNPAHQCWVKAIKALQKAEGK